MPEAEGSIVIDRPINDIAGFILNLETYRQADTKFRRIYSWTVDGDTGAARYSGTLRGIPTPTVDQIIEIEPDRSEIRFRPNGPRWADAIARLYGGFTLHPTEGGTLVTHTERLVFPRALRWIAEPILRKWWARELTVELARMKELLERAVEP
jgi:hypothetical protein